MGTVILAGLGLFAGAVLFSLLLTRIVMARAGRSGFVAEPKIDRYNKRTVALGGGIAIFATIFFFLVAALIVVKLIVLRGYACGLNEEMLLYADGFASKTTQLLVLLGCLTALHILGLIDDIKHLGPYVKLIVQFAVAFAAARFGDIRVELFVHNIVITSLLSAVWIVIIINAFNFLDNMDGLSCGIAAIVAAILLTAALRSGQVFVGALAILFIGSLVGFLVFNFPPAKIFMGDAGSLVVGFMVASLSLKTTYFHQADTTGLYAVFMPLIVMAVPLYDFVSVSFLRIKQGKSPFVGDTQHFSHRLKKRGLNDTQVALTLYLATLCCGISALFLYQVNLTGAVLIFVHTIMILIIIAIFESFGGAIEQN